MWPPQPTAWNLLRPVLTSKPATPYRGDGRRFVAALVRSTNGAEGRRPLYVDPCHPRIAPIGVSGTAGRSVCQILIAHAVNQLIAEKSSCPLIWRLVGGRFFGGMQVSAKQGECLLDLTCQSEMYLTFEEALRRRTFFIYNLMQS